MSGSSNESYQAMAMEVGAGREESANDTGGLKCPGCMKTYKRQSEFDRHWRVPIPCQIPGCFQTFRDDKMESYISHCETKHSMNGQQATYRAQLMQYFASQKRELRKNIRTGLCTLRNPQLVAASQDASGNGPLNLEQESTSPPRLAPADMTASHGLGEAHAFQAGGSSLDHKISELEQDLSHRRQYIDYLEKIVLKEKDEQKDAERRLKLLEQVREGLPQGMHSRALPSDNHPDDWMNDYIDLGPENEQTAFFQ